MADANPDDASSACLSALPPSACATPRSVAVSRYKAPACQMSCIRVQVPRHRKLDASPRDLHMLSTMAHGLHGSRITAAEELMSSLQDVSNVTGVGDWQVPESLPAPVSLELNWNMQFSCGRRRQLPAADRPPCSSSRNAMDINRRGVVAPTRAAGESVRGREAWSETKTTADALEYART